MHGDAPITPSRNSTECENSILMCNWADSPFDES